MEIFDNKILQDLLHYGERTSFKYKVFRVYHKCVRARKIKLADRIYKKYVMFFADEKYSDSAIAFAMMLKASQNNQK